MVLCWLLFPVDILSFLLRRNGAAGFFFRIIGKRRHVGELKRGLGNNRVKTKLGGSLVVCLVVGKLVFIWQLFM